MVSSDDGSTNSKTSNLAGALDFSRHQPIPFRTASLIWKRTEFDRGEIILDIDIYEFSDAFTWLRIHLRDVQWRPSVHPNVQSVNELVSSGRHLVQDAEFPYLAARLIRGRLRKL